MSMKKGIEEVAIKTLDIKDELFEVMLDAGIPALEASRASSIATKRKMDEIIDRAFGGKDASNITQNLSELGRKNR